MNATWIACDRGDYSDYDGECVVILGDDRRVAIVFDDDDALLIASAPILADENAALKEQLSEAQGDIGILNVKDAAHIAARQDMRDEIAVLKEQFAAAEQARAVAEGNLELRSMSNEGLRQLIGEMIEGLEPSAIFADALDDETPDEIAIGIYAGGGMQFGPSGGMNVGHLRIARDIITRARGAAS